MRSAAAVLSPKVLEAVREVLGIEQLNEVQLRAIPEILAGKNVLIVAPTGSGKTEAAVLPVLDRILGEKGGIKALYITPLRALNRDILRRLVDLGRRLGIEIDVRHGDTEEAIRRRQARRPPRMLITTPETLQAILPGRVMQQHLRGVRFVIIDEIHELLDDKRGVQLLLGLERLRRIAGFDFQRIGLSATVGDPWAVAELMRGSSERETVVVDARLSRRYEILVDYPQPTDEDRERSMELGIPAEALARIRTVIEECRRHRSVLIFTNTREAAEALAHRMRLLEPDLELGVHHGSLSKEERIEAESGLREGRLRALVCTASLELGIDIGHVDFVIHYGSPRRAEALLQRVGRAGHRLGGVARGLIIATNEDEIAEAAVLAKMALRGELEPLKVHACALDVLAHQIAGLVLDHGEIDGVEAYRIVRGAGPYRGLRPQQFLRVIKQLVDERKLRVEGRILSKRRETWLYYYENLSTIPDVVNYEVIDVADDRRIGELDEEFIARYGREGLVFILAGRVWRILSIDHDERKVHVEESDDYEAAIPGWVGELIPVPFRCALEVGALRRQVAEALKKGEDPLAPLRGYPVSERAARAFVEYIRRAVERKLPIPCDEEIVIEDLGRLVVIHAPLGSNGCYTLGLLVSRMLSERLQTSVAFRNDAYRVGLQLGEEIPELGSKVASTLTELANLDEEGLERGIREALESSELYKWRLYHVARRFGLLSREAGIGVLRGRLLSAIKDTPVHDEAIRELITDKVDLDAVRWFLEGLRSGRLRLTVIRPREPSPFAEPMLRLYFYELLPARRPARVLVEVVKRRLNSRTVKLVCLRCLRWEEERTVGLLPERLRCPRCGAAFIAVMPRSSGLSDLRRILAKRARGGKLTEEERELLKRAQESARLVLTYGRRAVIALAAKGVGPHTAVRILREAQGEDDFYLKILEAEKQYLRTRRFWEV